MSPVLLPGWRGIRKAAFAPEYQGAVSPTSIPAMMDSPEIQEKKLQKLARFLGRKIKQLEKIKNQLKTNNHDVKFDCENQ